MIESKSNKIGIVVCDRESPNPKIFKVQLEERWKEEKLVGTFVKTNKNGEFIIGKICSVHPYSQFFEFPQAVEDSLKQGYELGREVPSSSNWVYASVEILGNLKGKNLEYVGDVPSVGSEVLPASADEVKHILNYRTEGIFLGYRFAPPKEPAILDPDAFVREHTITFGVTRWGKSYTNAVIIEELVKRNIPVVVIDPHGEYYSFAQPNDISEEIQNLPPDLNPVGFQTEVYSPPAFRVSSFEKELRVDFSELDPSEIIELTGTTGENQIAVVYEARRRLEGQNYTISEFIDGMREARDELNISAAIESVAGRLRALERGINAFGIFNPSSLVRPGQISIINLSGLDLRTQQVLVTCMLRRLFSERQYGNIEGFSLFIDEVQRFAPNAGSPVSKHVVEEIAKEGLKFGVSLHVMAQRPTEVSDTVRSESETKIFHKLTELAEVNYARSLIEIKAPELVEAIPRLGKGEVVIVGGCTNYIPDRIKIRPRQSKHVGRAGALRKRKRSVDKAEKESLQRVSLKERQMKLA
jgi:hypothetical protein